MINFRELRFFYLQEIIKTMIVFFVIQFFLIFLDFKLDLSFIFCPLIYLYKRNVNDNFVNNGEYKLIKKHLFFYLLMVLFSAYNPYNLFLWLLVFYFVSYAFLIKKELRKQVNITYFRNSKHLISLFMYFIILAICVAVLQLCEFYFGNIFGFSTRTILMAMMIMNVVFAFVCLLTLQSDKGDVLNVKEPLVSSDLGLKILAFFENSEEYFNPNFKIDDLARILDVNKILISDVINNELKMRFFTLVAKYRINRAKKVLVTQEHFTIESLVGQCGFHSRSTFNKYFQQFVGVKPSEYRKEYFNNLEKLD